MDVKDIFVFSAGLVVNGLRILDLASERDERVAIQGDVELEVKVMRPSHQ